MWITCQKVNPFAIDDWGMDAQGINIPELAFYAALAAVLEVVRTVDFTDVRWNIVVLCD